MVKTLLLSLFIVFAYLQSMAQNVVIQDSAYTSYRGGPFTKGATQTHTYNDDCVPVKIISASNQSLYLYTPEKKPYQLIFQVFSTDSATYINNNRTTYTYDTAGNISLLLTEHWDQATGIFVNASLDSLFYDQNGFQARGVSQNWDTVLLAWKTRYEVNTFNNDKGQADSVIANDYNNNIVTRTMFTYYSGDNKVLQATTYSYLSGVLYSTSRQTKYVDSVNYVRKETTVFESGGVDSNFSVSSTGIITNYYNTDNTVRENDYVSVFASDTFLFVKNFITYAPCSSVLPVTFINFSAVRQNNNALLNWQTAGETNTSLFTVQRSLDGEHFTTVGNVKVSGNSSRQTYSYNDVNALLINTSKLYYRITEQDDNGSINYSKTVTLNITAGKLSVYVSPNPVINNINIYAAIAIGAAQIIVSDMKGNVVYSGKQNIVAGNKVSIDASGFAKGMYIVTIQSASYKEQLKIIKE